MHGFENYSDLLNLLHTDLQTRRNLFNWLERGRSYNEEEDSFIPLVRRGKSLEKPFPTPKKERKKKKEKNELFNWEKSLLNLEKDDIWIESGEDLKGLLDFLRCKNVKYALKDEERIIKRLRWIAKDLGFNSFSGLLTLFGIDPQTLDNVVGWLEKGRVFNEEENSFIPLVKRDNILRDTVPRKKTKKKLKKKSCKIAMLEKLPSIPDPSDTKNLSLIFNFLSANNVNFQAYKEKYFLRRLHSRMTRIEANTYRDYLEILETDPMEINLLINNLSINVTHFFRDKDLWTKLDQDFLPKISADRSKSIRIWSAGCTIGPEPYSIAILMFEKIKQANLDKLYILATDIRQEFLDKAQVGVYSKDLLEEINPGKIQKYFNPIGQELFQLSANIREKVIFKNHDLRKPPPFRNFDLILCRNVLIYFSRNQAEALFQRFHSVLKPNGYLILGKCELVPIPIRHLFKVIDSKSRIYQRKNV